MKGADSRTRPNMNISFIVPFQEMRENISTMFILDASYIPNKNLSVLSFLPSAAKKQPELSSNDCHREYRTKDYCVKKLDCTRCLAVG